MKLQDMEFTLKLLNLHQMSKLSRLLKHYSCEAIISIDKGSIDAKSVLGLLSVMSLASNDNLPILTINELDNSQVKEFSDKIVPFLYTN